MLQSVEKKSPTLTENTKQTSLKTHLSAFRYTQGKKDLVAHCIESSSHFANKKNKEERKITTMSTTSSSKTT